MERIIFVAHCVLNPCAKVKGYGDLSKERAAAQDLIIKAAQQGISLVQLPCPEFTLYGSRRWGHAMGQFDNVFYKNHCRALLQPMVDQIAEYLSDKERFAVMAIVGINGSPSCGVDFTYDGPWGGEFGENPNLQGQLGAITKVDKNGVFVAVLRQLLAEREIYVPIVSVEELKL